MRLCVSMWSMHRKFFHEGWNISDFLQFCKKEGIETVELLDVFWRDKEQELPSVQSFLKESGIAVGAYAVSNDFVQLDEMKREIALQSVLNGIQVAKELNTKIVRVFAGDMKAGSDFNSSFEYIVNGLRVAASVAKEEGVVLALENHGKLAGRADQVQQIIASVGSPALQSAFDMGNFLLVEQDPFESYQQLSTVIGHVHVKDLMISSEGKGFLSLGGQYYKGMTCGEGQVPIKRILDNLRDTGYSGSVSLEFEGDGDESDAVLQSLVHLRVIM